MKKIVKEKGKIYVQTSFKKYEFETEAEALAFIKSCKKARAEMKRGNRPY